MSETTTRWKWWWGFDMEKIAAWLEGLESEGWRLERIGFLGIAFHFVKADPETIRYCVDYQQKTTPEYERIFADSGWELAPGLHWAGWYFWRKGYSGEKPEIFTDKESLIARNKRYLATLFILIVVQFPLLNSSLSRGDHGVWFVVLKAFQVAVVLLLAYALVRVVMANRRLAEGKNP